MAASAAAAPSPPAMAQMAMNAEESELAALEAAMAMEEDLPTMRSLSSPEASQAAQLQDLAPRGAALSTHLSASFAGAARTISTAGRRLSRRLTGGSEDNAAAPNAAPPPPPLGLLRAAMERLSNRWSRGLRTSGLPSPQE